MSPRARRATSATDPVLVTGFGPFAAVSDNPSARVARRLHGADVEGRTIVGAVLPVTFDGAVAAITELIADHAPAAVIALGAGRGDAVRLEQAARRVVHSAQPDTAGAVWAGRCPTAEGPEQLTARAPIGPLAATLTTPERPVVPSSDAGGYVCESTFYAALAAGAAPTLFVHLPHRTASADIDAYAALVRAVAATLVQPT